MLQICSHRILVRRRLATETSHLFLEDINLDVYIKENFFLKLSSVKDKDIVAKHWILFREEIVPGNTIHFIFHQLYS